MDALTMSVDATQRTALLEWSVASAALPGEARSGDGHYVRNFLGGALVAAVDGIGHGDEAAVAAKLAVSILDAHPQDHVISLFRRCHEGLLKTRGVVMSVASFSGSLMTWMGVGNLEGILLRAQPGVVPAQETLLLRGGVVGYQLPNLQAAVVPVSRGDTLVFATDGVRSGFADGLHASDPPSQIASQILARFKKGTDDALVLVARYVGGGAP
ncbi:MAG TPA: SpoIIE family protein phosphatase [Thermoanaerobaculia bacterium]|nr:SpoIIE family protein phosphatase [Thermoanaerobaculia bacterium]